MDRKMLCFLMIHVQGTTLQETRNHIPPNDKKTRKIIDSNCAFQRAGDMGQFPGGLGSQSSPPAGDPPPGLGQKKQLLYSLEVKKTHTHFSESCFGMLNGFARNVQ